MSNSQATCVKRSSVVRVLLMAGLGGLLMLLLIPTAARALGGGGIGGFGDGGGVGGGGGGAISGGGHFFGGGGGSEEDSTGIAIFAMLLILCLIGCYIIISTLRVRPRYRHTKSCRRLSPRHLFQALLRVVLWPIDLMIEWWQLGPRQQQISLAAAEASESDLRFASDVVCSDAEQLFRAIQDAWTKDDRARLSRLVGEDLMVEWEERLKGFARRGWSNRIDLYGSINIHYVGLRNTADERDRRVIVRVSSRVRDVVIDSFGNTIHRKNSIADIHHMCEYWTLGLSDKSWILLSIEQHQEGLHQLQEPIVASPWSDTETLHREATLEQVARVHVENSQLHTIASADLTLDARSAALDLSLVDDRFAPHVLTGEVENAVRAWAEAIDGKDASLEAVASPTAIAELLYPGDPDRQQRLVVRGPYVQSVRVLELDAHDTPPWMLVELHISGRRYQEDRTTATILKGDRSAQTNFTMRWRMELTEDVYNPWRIAQVGGMDYPRPGGHG
jgi:predicted lipid-binding transport protein (Tim44 family)